MIFSCLKRIGCTLVLFILTKPLLAEGKFERPLVVIPEITGPSQSIKATEDRTILENFLSVDADTAPREITRLGLWYDKTHLYVSGKVLSYALDPTSNMTDSFSAKAVKRDEPVTADDSVEIRIEPSNGAKYSIAINSLGTIQDMRYESHPDKTWNGSITASARKEDGFWTFQMAIPFASLDLSKVSEGDEILFNAIRHDSSRNERSVLDHHSITLVFGGTSAFVQIPFIEQPLTSSGSIPIEIHSAKGQTLAWKRELLKNETLVSASSGSLLASSNAVNLDLTSSSEGKPHANKERFSVYASGHPIYRSPAFPWRDVQSEIKISAEADVPFSLAFNGKTLSSGSTKADVPFSLAFNGKTLSSGSTKVEKAALLMPGTNELTVRIPIGHMASVKIIGPDGSLLKTDDLWKNPENSSQESVYKKIIAYQVTPLSPDFPDGICKLATGSAQFLHWDGGASKNWNIDEPLSNFRLVVDVPEGLRFLGASGYVSPPTAATETGGAKASDVAEYTWTREGQVQHGALNFDRYIISRNRPVVLSSKKESWAERQERRRNGLVFAIQDARKNATDVLPPIYYGMAAENIVEIPNKLEFEELSRLEGQMPTQIVLSLYTRLGLIKDPDLLEKFFDTIKEAGINEVFCETLSEYPRKIGLRQSTFFGLGQSSWAGFQMGTLMTDSIIQAYPEAQAVNFYGKKMGTPCLAWLAEHEEAWPMIEEQIAAMAKRNPSMSHFFWDYEFPPFPEGIHAYPMFSKFGIETFRERFGIKEELSPEIIRKKYADKWVEYTCSEIARVVARLRQAAEKHGLDFTMYSGYHMPYTQRRYNVDWSKIGPHLDLAYCGYTNDRLLIEETRRALNGTPLAGALLAQGPSAPRRSAATIIRTLINSGGGVLFWYEGGGFDGETLEPIAAASRFASAYKTFITEGTRENVPGISQADQEAVVLLRHHEEVLLILLNETKEPRTFQFDLPTEIVENYSADELQMRQGTKVAETVEPGMARTFLLRKKAEANNNES